MKTVKRTYVTPSNVAYYETLCEDAGAGESNWTISRHARRGDRMVLYICAPVSALVAVATIATHPELDDDPSSEWYGHHFADVRDLRLLREPIKRVVLRMAIPDWRYFKQPRNCVAVPPQFEPKLSELLILHGA